MISSKTANQKCFGGNEKKGKVYSSEKTFA
jgi:hypothetical protein